MASSKRQLGSIFSVMGIINLYVAYNYSTDTWVNFKLFGFMGLMFAFVILQAILLGKYVEKVMIRKSDLSDYATIN